VVDGYEQWTDESEAAVAGIMQAFSGTQHAA
jgi:hypothetical protein